MAKEEKPPTPPSRPHSDLEADMRNWVEKSKENEARRGEVIQAQEELKKLLRKGGKIH